MDFRYTNASICDSNGNMLFYTNGYYIADANNDTLLNGTGISPGQYANMFPDGFLIPQAALAIQKPGSDSLYYLFHSTVDNPPDFTESHFLYYSVIDISTNNGLGEVISKNNIAITDIMNGGKIAATKHGNGRDWWIMVHRAYTNIFIKILVTPYGIDGPFYQTIGSVRDWDAGQAKFSPDGTRYAYYHYRNNTDLDVFDFDRCSGLLSNWRNDTIEQIVGNVGMEFSPNSQYVYVSNIVNLYQYDCNPANLASGRILVATYDGFYDSFPPAGTYFCQTQIAPDGKVYVATGNSTRYYHIIAQPDSPGLACNVIQHGLMVPFYFNTIPNHPNYFLGANGLCNNLSYESLESGKVKKVTVFGNPTHDKFTLWFPPDKDVGELEIYDVNGNHIRNERVAQWSQYKTVDIGEFSAGVYFCKMRWPSGEGSCRVVKF
ncbi:MAG: T9SS type A sorting domain-containing protein [Bacteroidetes bacterium]|nr:T9SS type A sorting domain-containing protein [Bacteroidota bacterium]